MERFLAGCKAILKIDPNARLDAGHEIIWITCKMNLFDDEWRAALMDLGFEPNSDEPDSGFQYPT